MKHLYFPILILTVLVILGSCNAKVKTKAIVSDSEKPGLKISLAQWSVRENYFANSAENWNWFVKMIETSPDSVLQGKDNPFNFPELALSYGVNTIELVNTFYYGKVNDNDYWLRFKHNCDSLGVNINLIMCDILGDLADTNQTKRMVAIKKHFAWIDVAEKIGAGAIRVNLSGRGSESDMAKNAIHSLQELCDYASDKKVTIVVENHGGYSSNGKWLASVIKSVNRKNVGTLPDFGNFCLQWDANGCVKEYDRYLGVKELMPFAYGVSAKTKEFDSNGNEVFADYSKMMKIVHESGFNGYIGIEYEGGELSPNEGIMATKKLIEKTFN